MIIIKEKFKVIFCSQDQNSVERGVRGILPLAQIERMYENMMPEERDARRYGKFIHLSGLIFKEFRDRVLPGEDWCHVFNHDKVFREEARNTWKDWSVYLGIDTHQVLPFYTLAVKVDPRGRLYAFDEIIEEGPYNTIRAIRERYDYWGREPDDYLIEPQAKQVDATSQKSVMQILREEGIWTRQWQKHNSGRIHEIHENLRFDPKLGRPKLLVSSRCVELIKELKRWCYKDETGKPIDKGDHMIDCLGGILCSSPQHTEPYDPALEKQYVPMGHNGY